MSTASIYLRQLVGKLVRPDSAVNNLERVSGIDLTLKVMALLATADGKIDDAEIRLTQQFYAAQTGAVVSAETIRRAIENVAAEPESLWRDLGACDHLSTALREDIYLIACQAAAADGDIHEAESALLQRIGDSLGITPARRTGLASAPVAAPTTEPAPLTATEISRFSLMVNSRGGQVIKHIFHRAAKDSDGMSAELRSLATDLTLQAMALMCLADSTVEQAELRLIGEIYAALGSGEVGSKTLERAAAIVAAEPRQAWQALDQAVKLDEATRRDILRAANQVARIDGQFDPREQALLERLAVCMQLPVGEIESAV